MIIVGIALDGPVARTVPEHVMTEEEFELFYRRNSRPFWGYISRVTGDATLADDIFQRAFFQFLRSPHDTTEDARLRGLLYRIGSNLIIDHWRQKKRERGLFVPDDPGSVEPGDPTIRWDFERAFEEMNPRERAMLWLAHVEGAEHKDIATALGLREKSVKVLLHRARKKLAGILRAKGFTGRESK